MKERARFLATLFVEAADRWDRVEGSRLGAAFSFYALFSVFPLILLFLTIIGFVIGDDSHARASLMSAVATDASVRQVVDSTLAAMQSSRSARGMSLIIALGTLAFSASGAFVELDVALNRIWEMPPRQGPGVWGTIRAWVHDRLAGVTIVLGIAASLLASLVGSTVLGAVAERAGSRLTPALLQTAELAMSIALLSAVFTAAFHFVPRSRPPWRDVVGGAVLTTVLLTVLKAVFASYLAHLTTYSAYGVVGGVLALGTWIFLSSQVIIFGASLTRVHCEKTGCPAATRAAPPLPTAPAAPPLGSSRTGAAPTT
jgi:membrane protein